MIHINALFPELLRTFSLETFRTAFGHVTRRAAVRAVTFLKTPFPRDSVNFYRNSEQFFVPGDNPGVAAWYLPLLKLQGPLVPVQRTPNLVSRLLFFKNLHPLMFDPQNPPRLAIRESR